MSDQSRRDFIKAGAVTLMSSAMAAGCATLSEEQAITRKKFAGLERLGPVMGRLEVREGAVKGKVAC